MALIVADRVQETSTTTGTGAITLAGAVTGFRTFGSVMVNTDTTYYTITDQTSTANWEVGLGTWGTGNILTRTTILKSSNANAAVNFTSGALYVFMTYPADKAVYEDANNRVSGYVIDGSSVGSVTPSTGAFTTLSATGSLTASAQDNTISGFYVGRGQANSFSTTGNIFLGYAPLNTNTGTSNTVIGSNLTALTTGFSNILIRGGNAITSGNGNIAIGGSALNAVTTQASNIAIGPNALATNTANSNIAIGSQALSSNTSSVNNVAIGPQSLQNNTGASAFQNVAVGYSTAAQMTSGTDNVFVGYNAGNSITSGTGNVYIGSNIAGPSSAQNQVIIGNVVSPTISNNEAAIYAGGEVFRASLTKVTIPGQLQSNATTGTAPFVISSTTQVANLNVATAGTLVLGATLPAGTASLAPLTYTSGTNLSAVVAGATEYDGTVFYKTPNTTSGRGYAPAVHIFRLNANGGTISTINNFFGANSAINLAAGGFYEIEAYCYFLKTTAGTVVVTATTSLAPANLSGVIHTGAIAGGTAAGVGQQIALFNSTATAAAFAATGSLSNGANHVMRIMLSVEANASASNLRINFTSSAGSVTPLRNSYYKVTRLPAGNSGSFAA